jgi:hypothetical protein
MSRYARRQDASQGPIADVLRLSGLSVRDNSGAGRGAPDLWVSFGGLTAGVECKTEGTQYGKRLQDSQVKWREGWEGEVVTLKTTIAALAWANQFKRKADPMNRRALWAEAGRGQG